jgi:hypothetical protein
MKKSIFTNHYNNLMSINDTEELLSQITAIVDGEKLDPISRRKITLDINKCGGNHLRLQTYITNSMLKFQGLGTIH